MPPSQVKADQQRSGRTPRESTIATLAAFEHDLVQSRQAAAELRETGMTLNDGPSTKADDGSKRYKC